VADAALPKEGGFYAFYAANYFLRAVVSAGFLVAILAGQGGDIFAGLLTILLLYDFIITLVGINVMNGRLKQYKQNGLALSSESANIVAETAKA